MPDPSLLERQLAQATTALSSVYSPQAIPSTTSLAAAAEFKSVAEAVFREGDAVVAALGEALARPQVRFAAARLLAARGDVASLRLLLAAMRDAEETRSSTAGRALMQLRAQADSAELLVGELRARPSPLLRHSLLYALLSLPDADLVSRLGALWPGISAADRVICLETIGARGGSEVLQFLQRAAEDRDSKVVLEAATGLCVRGQRQRMEDLLGGLAAKSPGVRAQAVSGLGRVSLPDGVEGVSRALADGSPTVRLSALLSAVFVNDTRLHPRVQALVTDPKSDVRHQALSVLREIVGEPPVPAAELPPGRRLFRGRPARLEDYVELLAHPTYGAYAASQLSSATGEPTDFAPGKDLVFNLDAIQRWAAVLAGSAGQRSAGAWYYQGRDVTTPPSGNPPVS